MDSSDSDSVYRSGIIYRYDDLLYGHETYKTKYFKNYNVNLSYIIAIFAGLSTGCFNIAPLFITLAFPNKGDIKLGYITTIRFGMYTISAIVFGLFLDKFQNKRVIMTKYAGITEIIASIITIITVIKVNLDGIYIANCFKGLADGLYSASVSTVVADSIETGKRSAIEVLRNNCVRLANVVVCLIISGIYLKFLSGWDYHTCKWFVVAYSGFCIITGILMLFFKKDAVLDKETEGFLEKMLLNINLNNPEQPLLYEEEEQRHWLFKWVPHLAIISDIIICFGSGLLIQFIPIWYEKKVGLDPKFFMLIMALNTFGIAIASIIIQKISEKILGRGKTIIISKLFSISLGFILAFTDKYWHYFWYVIPVYFLRTSFINATGALIDSVTMDFVPKKRRGIYNGILSIMTLGWAGSSILGGYILDNWLSFKWLFIISMSIQTLGTLIWFPIAPIIPKEHVE